MASNDMNRKGKKNKNEVKRKIKQAALTTISHIPDDVIMQILPRVRAKSLRRFRWVCKHWFSLISSPSFVRLQLHRSTHDIVDNTSILRYDYLPKKRNYVLHSFNYMDDDDERPVPEMKLPPPLLDCINFATLGSCNGLLCIGFSIRSSSSSMICIWNPCTNETRTLPELPSQGLTDHGFGYDRHTDDYKVIRTTRTHHCGEGHYKATVDVYSLGANSWKTIDGTDMPPYKCLCRGVYANGAIYWWMFSVDNIILRFDLDKEEFSRVSRPNEMHQKYGRLGEYRGCVTILDLVINIEKSLNFWMMKEYDGQKDVVWVKLFTIKLPIPMVRRSSRLSYYSIILCKNDEILARTDNGRMVWYNPKYDKIRYLPVDIKGTGFSIYTESLVPLNSRVERS